MSNVGWIVLIAIAVVEKITHQEIPQDAKTTILEIAAGVSLYFNGKPSHVTEKLLKKVAGYELDSVGVGSIPDRGANPGGIDYSAVSSVGAWDDAGRSRESGLNRASVAPPESIEPNSDRAKAAAWYAADVARGRAMPPDKFAEWARSANEDESGPQSEAW
ncbi:MAG: hypothetical protein ACRC62_22990 [Microcoleus sp.]